MNKALEQKLIGPMEESHTKEQSPKQFWERCFEQGDRKSEQNELELVLELDIGVCGRKKECVGAGICGGGPPWAHEAGARPRGVGTPSPLVGRWLAPLVCSQFHKSSNILEKNLIPFSGHLENFYFRCIFILHG